ncbi:MAG: DNA polymerase/3'-5' exonuclease PolX [Bacteroidetes bacterium]|nr:DNA polymerase/3'-5' exonuclease PolX [Bacteroidota bacterium]
MAIDNGYISDQLSLLSKLMDIHGENAFKIKSYSIAAFTIDKLPEQLSTMAPEKIFAIKGIGENTGKKIIGILQTGELAPLTELIAKTPPGILEMLKIKGLGPKKIATIWKEMEIESIGELLYACNENRLLLYKGFGEKTQNSVRESIEFYLKSQGAYLFSEAVPFASLVQKSLSTAFPNEKFQLTGSIRRQLEVIDKLEWVTTAEPEKLKTFLSSQDFKVETESDRQIVLKGDQNIPLIFHFANLQNFISLLFETSCSDAFWQAWKQKTKWDDSVNYPSEEAIFETAKIHFIPAFQREDASIIDEAGKNSLPSVIQLTDIKSIIHSHSNWSDGSFTIEEMAKTCIEKGFEYLVISDHSKSAFYANGLTEERIQEQHRYIDELNKKFAPFKIFKSIESDILNDGSLDYSDPILSTFDLVIASVHSNLKMSEDKAMARLLKAIENPYTNILGHMTGRLLLSRPGYPLDHKKIIEACAANQVVIELNAHPRRLDIDWRWIKYALEKEVLISIDPDAHYLSGFDDILYGTLVAQKAGLTKERNLSSFGLSAFEKFLATQKSKIH